MSFTGLRTLLCVVVDALSLSVSACSCSSESSKPRLVGAVRQMTAVRGRVATDDGRGVAAAIVSRLDVERFMGVSWTFHFEQ